MQTLSQQETPQTHIQWRSTVLVRRILSQTLELFHQPLDSGRVFVVVLIQRGRKGCGHRFPLIWAIFFGENEDVRTNAKLYCVVVYLLSCDAVMLCCCVAVRDVAFGVC